MAKKEKVKKEEPAAEKPAGAEGEEGAPAKKKMAGKTLVLFIILPAVLVLGGGGAAVMMLMGGGSAKAETADATDGGHGDEKEEKKDEHGEEKKEDHGGGGGDGHGGGTAVVEPGAPGDVGHALECADHDPCYYSMPKLLVNLASTEGEEAPMMSLELTLEAASTSAFANMAELMPRLKDQLNAFLRELRVEDLNGSMGSYMMRRELLKRFNTVLDPKKIDAVLIEGMFIQ